jgi:glyoxylase-like metal-dependent hydrolase (beta-lactamase superfamily II)
MLKCLIIPVTPFQQNCSLVWCEKTKRAAAVDPGGDLHLVRQAIADNGVTLEKVLLTHGHLDHATAAGSLAEEFGVKIEIKGFSFSLEYQCSRCRKMKPAHQFTGRGGKVMKTCEPCRTSKK